MDEYEYEQLVFKYYSNNIRIPNYSSLHHRDLEEEECGEESNEEPPSDQETPPNRFCVVDGVQEQKLDKHNPAEGDGADGEVGVEDVEEPVLVCLVLPHVEEVDGESDQATHQEDKGDENDDNICYLVENIF